MGEDSGPIKVKCWVKFLEHLGCYHKSTKASHHKWTCPRCERPIVFWGDKKEMPRFHIRSNLKTLGVDQDYFNQWLKDNC